MKHFYSLLLLIVSNYSFSQYSNYYNVDVNSNSNVNLSGSVDINQNIDVSGNVNVNKTVTSIDYGALAQADAMRERNMIEQMKIQNENDRAVQLAIASDPVKAYDFGTDSNWKVPSKTRKELGWKEFKYMYHKVPHESLFIRGGSDGYTYINESVNGIKTELIILPAFGEDFLNGIGEGEMLNNIEQELSYNDYTEGTEVDLGDGNLYFLHKKDINRTKVARLDGFVGTLIFEDKYEKRITDNYVAIGVLAGKKYLFSVEVRYKGDKDEVTFEELEGRRYYLQRFINKTISTINYY